jgi:hypothetical protein
MWIVAYHHENDLALIGDMFVGKSPKMKKFGENLT